MITFVTVVFLLQAGILVAINNLNRKADKIMATLDQVVQDVSDESTLIDSVSVLITGLKQQIADALSGATLPPDVQAKVDAVFSTAESNKAKLSSALTVNTPNPLPPGA